MYSYNIRKERVKETVVIYTSKSEIEKVLVEATANENWNIAEFIKNALCFFYQVFSKVLITIVQALISYKINRQTIYIANSKLQQLADACNSQDECKMILDYLKYKLEVPAYEWRRILKSLNAMDYLLKNGPFRVQQDLRNEMFKNFTYYEDNLDKGSAIREKAILLADLLTSPAKLEDEREQARQYRQKLYPQSVAQTGQYGGMQGYSSNDNYGSNNNGYQEPGAIGNVAKNIGGIMSGASSYISAGLNYMKPGSQTQPTQNNQNQGSMPGFGSDSSKWQVQQNSNYNAYGNSGSAYAPPTAFGNSDEIIKDSSSQKWGSQNNSSNNAQTTYKPLSVPAAIVNSNVSTNNTDNSLKIKTSKTDQNNSWGRKKEEPKLIEKKSSDQKDKKKPKKSKRNRSPSSSSSSSSSSDSQDEKQRNSRKKDKVKSKTQEQAVVETNSLIELDPQPVIQQQQQQQTSTSFSFLNQSSNTQQIPQQQSLLDLLDTPPQTQIQQNQQSNSSVPFFLQNVQQQPQAQQDSMSQLNGIQFQSSQTQQTQNLFSNLQLKSNTQEVVSQQEPIVEEKKEPKDAWEMGMSFINLKNLKESQALPDPGSLEYINSNQKSNSNPVYINQNMTAAQNSAQNSNKFIPNIGGLGFQQQQQPVMQLTNFQNLQNPQQIPSQLFGQQQQQENAGFNFINASINAGSNNNSGSNNSSLNINIAANVSQNPNNQSSFNFLQTKSQ